MAFGISLVLRVLDFHSLIAVRWREFSRDKPITPSPLENDFRSSWAILCVKRLPHRPIAAICRVRYGGQSLDSSFHVVPTEPDCVRFDGAIVPPRTFSANGKTLALGTTRISDRRES